MAAENVGGGCPKFNSIIFGENCKYIATRYGNEVLIRGKDGSVRKTDINTFMMCLAASLPKMKGQPVKDGFSPSNPLKNMTEIQKINPDDGFLTRVNKAIHNGQAIHLNPTKISDYVHQYN